MNSLKYEKRANFGKKWVFLLLSAHFCSFKHKFC